MKTRHGLIALTMLTAVSLTAVADSTYQTLPFSQAWTNTGLITVNDNWSGVPGVVGFLGDHDPAGAVTAVDPTTLTADSPVAIDVIANQTAPNTNISGGVGEFEITDPAVALQGSGTADAPFIKLHLNTTQVKDVQLSYIVRDIDGSADNSVQPVAAQYRTASSGVWTNIPGSFIADATTGPSLATQTTPVNVALPNDAANRPIVEVRILTTNAVGSDEWVGIDNIQVSGFNFGPAETLPSAGTWGMIALASMIAASGAAFMIRRRQHSAI